METHRKGLLPVIVFSAVMGILAGIVDGVTDISQILIVLVGVVVTALGLAAFRRPGTAVGGLFLFCLAAALTNQIMSH